MGLGVNVDMGVAGARTLRDMGLDVKSFGRWRGFKCMRVYVVGGWAFTWP